MDEPQAPGSTPRMIPASGAHQIDVANRRRTDRLRAEFGLTTVTPAAGVALRQHAPRIRERVTELLPALVSRYELLPLVGQRRWQQAVSEAVEEFVSIGRALVEHGLVGADHRVLLTPESPDRSVSGRSPRETSSPRYIVWTRPLACADLSRVYDTALLLLQRDTGGRTDDAADLLQVHPQTVRYRLRKLGNLYPTRPTTHDDTLTVLAALHYLTPLWEQELAERQGRSPGSSESPR